MRVLSLRSATSSSGWVNLMPKRYNRARQRSNYRGSPPCGWVSHLWREHGDTPTLILFTPRADDYIPRKPGHLFNAGAALRAVKWAPRADGPSHDGEEK